MLGWTWSTKCYEMTGAQGYEVYVDGVLVRAEHGQLAVLPETVVTSGSHRITVAFTDEHGSVRYSDVQVDLRRVRESR